MKQKLTTFLLALLVFSSLLLTYRLWYGHHPSRQVEPLDEKVPEKVFFELPRPLEDTITPERILVESGDGDGFYLLRYGQENFNLAWEEISLALQALTKYEYRARESLGETGAGLKIWFNPPLPVGAGTPWLQEDRYRELAKLELWLDGEESWAILQEKSGGDAMALKLPGRLATLFGEAAFADSTPYILLAPELPDTVLSDRLSGGEELVVPLSPPVLPELVLVQENLDRESLVDAFFVDRNLVRKIQEKAGAVIYTDGTKGLRIKKGMEFSDPIREKSLTPLAYLSALNACNKYICSYGGWPAELRLKQLIIHSEDGYRVGRACWEYYWKGYPLVGSNPALSLVFTSSGLVEYCRLVYTVRSLGERLYQVASWSSALEEATDFYDRLYGETSPPALEAIDLVYYVKGGPSYQPVAVPAWQVIINGKQILLQAEDLTPFEGGDQ